MQQGRLLTLVNIQSASGPLAGQFSVGGNMTMKTTALGW
jgi:hypothetical protein